MPRTDATEINKIIETDETVSLTPFIIAASQLVEAKCAVFPEYTSDELKNIETWLAAHFYTVLDPRAVQEQAGSVQVTYQSKVDLGLNTSHYGQMAKLLDYRGGLAGLENDQKDNKGPVTVGINWVGTVLKGY